MMTPQEVASHSFAKATLGGYNLAMVDEFLDALTEDYTALYNENAILKNKLKVLSDTVEEYRATEATMRKTLLAAQEMSDKLVKETEAKCAQMAAEVESRSVSKQTELAQGFSGEEQKLQAAKASVEEYKKQVRAICQQQLDYLDKLDQVVVPVVPTIPAADSAAQEIQAAVARDLAQQEEELSQSAPAPKSVDQEVQEPTTEIPVAPAVQPVAPAVEESSVSLYEQLMAHRRAAQEPPKDPDPTAPTRRVERRSLEFGKDFEID